MTPELEQERGRIAASLLENEIYKEAVETVRTAILDTWANSPIRDTEGQHELRLMLKALNDVNGHVQQVMNTGKMAKIQQEEKRNLFDRIIRKA